MEKRRSAAGSASADPLGAYAAPPLSMFFQHSLLSLRPPVSSARRYASGTPKPRPPLGSRDAVNVSPAAEPPTERFRSPRVYTFRRIALATAIPGESSLRGTDPEYAVYRRAA